MSVAVLFLLFAGVPEGLDLEEVTPWEERSGQLLAGPPGCWEIVGNASWNYDFSPFGTSKGDAVFVGRLDEGVWTDFHVEPLGEVRTRGKRGEPEEVFSMRRRFQPMLGRMERPPAEDEEEERDPLNALEASLEELGRDVEISWLTWDDEGGDLVLHREIPVGDAGKARAKVQTRFRGGASVPSHLAVRFDQPFMVGELPRRAKVTSAEVQLFARGFRGHAIPSKESARFTISVLGLSMGGAQSIAYRKASPCRSGALEERYRQR